MYLFVQAFRGNVVLRVSLRFGVVCNCYGCCKHNKFPVVDFGYLVAIVSGKLCVCLLCVHLTSCVISIILFL